MTGKLVTGRLVNCYYCRSCGAAIKAMGDDDEIKRRLVREQTIKWLVARFPAQEIVSKIIKTLDERKIEWQPEDALAIMLYKTKKVNVTLDFLT